MKVYALFPSKSSLLLLKGSGALLELFLTKKSGGNFTNQERKLNARHTLCEMVWYILTSAMLFFSSIATKDGSSPGIWSRPSCCAFPSSAPKRDTLHDRKYGHLSSYNISQKLTPGSLTVALCFFARHQRAIEQHSRLPREFQSSDLRNIEKYRLDTELYPIVTPALLSVLQADIGSSNCLTWFKNFWDTNQNVWGDIVALRSDPNRRADHALPSRESNIDALANGQMCLEDLLCFNHVIFRGTIHGVKETAYNRQGLEDIKQILMRSLRPSCFHDGNVDIGYVFYTSSEAGTEDFSLHLNRKVVAAGEILLPECANRPLKEYGGYMTGTAGYPYFIGYASKKGTCAKPFTSITPDGIRKVKAYSTKWRADSFRGQTVYSTPSAKSVQSQISNTKALYDLCLRGERKSVERAIQRVETGIECILHNCDYRAESVSSFWNRIGVRLEYTYYFDRLFQFFSEPLELLSLEDDGSGEIVPENCEEQVGKRNLPWWKEFRWGKLEEARFPFVAVSGRTMHLFSTLLEKRLLSLSLGIYKAGIRLLTNATVTGVSQDATFLIPILAQLGTKAAVKFTTVLSSAAYRAANYEVNSIICRIPKAIPNSPDGYLSCSGATASSWFSGYPAILLSRICRFPVFGASYEVRENGNGLYSVSAENALILSTEDDLVLPTALKYSNIVQRSEVRYLQLIAPHFDSGPDNIVHFVSKIIGEWCHAQEHGGSSIRFLSISLATLTVRFLIRDVFETMGAVQNSGSRRTDVTANLAVMDEGLTSALLTDRLTHITISKSMWPQEYQVYYTSSDCSTEDTTKMLCKEFDIERQAIVVQPGSRWIRKILPIDEGGFISNRDFIEVLWTTAEETATSRTSVETGNFPDGYNTRRWLSVYALQVSMQILKSKMDKSLFKKISQHFREGLSDVLYSAGFGRISPAFHKKCSGILRSTLGLWGPDMLFCRMKFVSYDGGQSGPTLDREKPEVESPEEEVRTIWEKLESIQKMRLRHEVGSKAWKELTQRYGDVSATFWNIPDIDDRIMSYIQSFFQKEKREQVLEHLDLTWIIKMIFSLVQLRRNTVDEGLSARRTNSKEILPARDLEVPSSLAKMLRYPWESIYPNPESVYGKKSRVKHVSNVLGKSFSLLFKVKTKADLGKDELGLKNGWKQLTVEDVYTKLSLEPAAAKSVLAHWRLCPTRLVAKHLLEM